MYVSKMNGDTPILLGPNNVSPPAELAALTHPEYRQRFAQWTKIRDCIEGEDAVKSRMETYLPRRARQNDESYKADLARASFFNATGRTQQSLLSSIFRRPGVVRLPTAMSTESVTRDGMSVKKVSRWLAEQVIAVTRAGAFVDLPAEESQVPQPHLCLYHAEHILSWHEEKGVLKMVLLAERIRDSATTTNMFNIQNKWQCRMLALDEYGEYYQLVGSPQFFTNMTSPPVAGRVYPEVYGRRIDSIPFRFFGAIKNSSEVEKPLILDIADLNIKHYIASANLERSRAFVGSPVYTTFTSGNSGDDDEALVVSPEVVWEFEANDKAEILEFKGSALSSLENGMEEKEEQMRVMGARLVSQRKNAAARSAGADSEATNSDDATLLDVVESVSEGVTWLLKIMARWTRNPEKDVMVVLNKHFNAPNIGARELRAIDACLNRSLRPKDIFQLLQEAGLISDDENEDEYISWIEKLKAEQEAATRAKLAQSVTPAAKPDPAPSKTGPAPGSTNS